MKKFLPGLLSFSLSLFLYGCPYDSPYNLDEEPQELVDDFLLGNWSTLVSKPIADQLTREDPVELMISRRTDKEYDIAITGHIDELKPYQVVTNDTIKGVAYLSNTAGRHFFNAFIHGKVYIAELVKDSNSISILPLAEYFTSKLIKNSRELRTAVEFHYKMRLRPGYDRLFVLRNLQRAN